MIVILAVNLHSRCPGSNGPQGQVLAVARGALLSVQVTVVVFWVKYGDWLIIVLYISSAVKTAPGVSMGGAAAAEVVEDTLLLFSSWPSKVSGHPRS